MLLDGRSHEALAACDVTLIASGTATLEAALFKRPMVIAYSMHALSWQIDEAHELPAVGRPAEHPVRDFVVPELLQDDATPEALAARALAWLDDAAARARRCSARFDDTAPRAAARHRAHCHRCDRRSSRRAEQLGAALVDVAGPRRRRRRGRPRPAGRAGRRRRGDPRRPAADPRPGRFEGADAARRASALYDEIRAKALCCCGRARRRVEEIDTLNILQATLLAMRRAVDGLRLKPAQGAGRRQPACRC